MNNQSCDTVNIVPARRKIGNTLKPIDLKVNYIDGVSEVNVLMSKYESVETSILYNNYLENLKSTNDYCTA